jgi:hypothetical protein
MAGRRSGWINWYAIGDEAEEDSGKLNYEYKWILDSIRTRFINVDSLVFTFVFSIHIWFDSLPVESCRKARPGRWCESPITTFGNNGVRSPELAIVLSSSFWHLNFYAVCTCSMLLFPHFLLVDLRQITWLLNNRLPPQSPGFSMRRGIYMREGMG